MIRLVMCVVVAAVIATAIGCGGSSPDAGSRFVHYRDPSGGWTADVPAGWTSVGLGPEFVRGEPLADPTWRRRARTPMSQRSSHVAPSWSAWCGQLCFRRSTASS